MGHHTSDKHWTKSLQKRNYAHDETLDQHQKKPDFFRNDNLLIVTLLGYTEHLVKAAKKATKTFLMIGVIYVANFIKKVWAKGILCIKRPELVLPHTFPGQSTRKP